MKKLVLGLSFIVFALASQAQVLNKLNRVKNKATQTTKETNSTEETTPTKTINSDAADTKSMLNVSFSEDEAVDAIKEALSKGISSGVTLLSKQNGYFGNPEVKIPFPKDAETIDKTLRKAGMGSKVDDVVLSINRAAEDAAISAKEIFIDAIKEMSISEGTKIVLGEKNAATIYLKKNTANKLYREFKPIIETSLNKVDATKYWDDAVSAYNKIPMVKDMNPDLTDYATKEAIRGLFIMVAKVEGKIRIDPVERTTDLLKKVFK